MQRYDMGRRAAGLAVAMALVAAACGGGDDDSSDSAGATTTEGAVERKAEPTAGTWKPWVLTSPTQFKLAAPPAAGSAESKAEEQVLKDAAANRSPEVVDAVKRFEGAGEPVSTEWVKMALEFVSAREKDPAASSRAYALVSVAAYDAMVATWHYKYQYNRRAPDVVEKISDVGPDPSYPSEHAVIAGATSKVLAYLFPERPALRLEEAADVASQSRIDAGTNWPSDVSAGLELGRQIGDAVVAYAKADGADAPCTPNRPGPGPRYWEPPPGKVANPVSPCAGSWKTWALTSGSQFRPGPPPVLGSPEFEAQAREVVKVKQDLTDEERKAASFWAGGQGTPLPAGIWNNVALAYLRAKPPSTPQAERIMALANVAMSDAGVAAWDTKYTYWDPRPENGVNDSGVEPGWKPLQDTPFFPSYISGHSTYSGAISELLTYFFPEDEKLFRDKAQEASNARVWGGIHWRADSVVGIQVGEKVGKVVVEKAKAQGAPPVNPE